MTEKMFKKSSQKLMRKILASVMLPIFVIQMSSLNVLLAEVAYATEGDVVEIIAEVLEIESEVDVAKVEVEKEEVAIDSETAEVIKEESTADSEKLEVAKEETATVEAEKIAEDSEIKVLEVEEEIALEVVEPVKDEEAPREEEQVEEEAMEEISDIKEATWVVDGKTATISPVELNKTYFAPQNDKVSVNFSKLPENPGSLSIEEITLTDEQVAELGALSNKAYDITSDMENGKFEYDLTLPKPENENNVQIKFAQDVDGLKEAKTVSDENIEVKSEKVNAELNHMTVFVVVGWNFPNNTDDNLADDGTTANNLIKTITGVGVNSITYLESARATGWDSGKDNKYWQIEFNSTGYDSLKLSSKQRSSDTGPKDFRVEYKIGSGTWLDLGRTITLGDKFNQGKIESKSLPSECDNQSSVFIRWMMDSNDAVNGGSVGGAGVSNIDDILVEGKAINVNVESTTIIYVDDSNNTGVEDGTEANPFNTIEKGLNVASDGKEIRVKDGNYVLSSTLTIDKEVLIVGESKTGVVINANGVNGYGITNNLGIHNITLKNFTLQGPIANSSGKYGLKITHTNNLIIENVRVSDSGRSEIDLNTVDGAILKNIEAIGNGTAGVGIALSNSANVTLENVSTINNAWGGVGLFDTSDGTTSDVNFEGANSFNEPWPIYIDEEYGHTVNNIDLPSDYDYAVRNDAFRDNEREDRSEEFTIFQNSEAKAIATALAMQAAPFVINSDSYIQTVGTHAVLENNFIVGDGMSIKPAVTSASSGADINVRTGIFEEQISVVEKNITIKGDGIDKTIVKSPEILNTSFTTSAANKAVMYIGKGDVNIKGLTVDGFSRGNSNYRMMGIAFYNGEGELDEVRVTRIENLPADGMQSGNAIYAYNDDGVERSITVKNSKVDHFQKNGITMNGAKLNANVENNDVECYGVIDFIAQNGIQFGWNSTGVIEGNNVNGCSYIKPSDETYNRASTAILLYDINSGLNITNNKLTNSDSGINAYKFLSELNIANNEISGNYWGVAMYDAESDNLINFSGNSFENNTVDLDNYTLDDIDAKSTKSWSVSNQENIDEIESKINHNCAGSKYSHGACNADDYVTGGSVDYVVLDETAPSVPTLISPADGSYLSSRSFLADWEDVNDSDLMNYDIEFYYNGAWRDLRTVSASQRTNTASYDLSWQWHVRSRDNAGNISEWSNHWIVTLDITNPAMTNYAISDTKLASTENNIILTGDIKDATSPIESVKYAIWDSTKSTVYANWTNANSVDGAYDSNNESTGHNIDVSTFPDGEFVLGVRGWDKAGNKSSGGDFYFTIDRTAPVVTVTPMSSLLRGTVAFDIAVTDNNLDPSKLNNIWTYLYNNLPPQAQKGAKVDLSTGHGIFTVDTTLLADGKATLDVGKLYDAVGNPSGNTDNYFRDYIIDNTAPTFALTDDGNPRTSIADGSVINPDNLGDKDNNGDTIRFSKESATDTLYVNDQPIFGHGYFNKGASGQIGAAFKNEGTYTLYVKDEAGNQSTSITFTVDKTAPDMPVHETPGDKTFINYNDFWFNWTDVNGAVSYEMQNSTNPAVDNDGSFQNVMWTGDYQKIQPTSSTAQSVGADGTWYWQVRAIDEAGNKSAWTTPWEITIDMDPPAQPKNIVIYKGHTTDLANQIQTDGYTNDTKIRIGWDAVMDVDYYWFGTKTNAHYKKVYGTYYDGNMTPGNNPYYYTVSAVDKAGNESSVATSYNIFLDLEKPLAPTLASPENNSFKKGFPSLVTSWSIVPDAVKYIYESYHDAEAKNSRWHEEFTTNSKSASNVSSAAFWWRVKAVDAAGNESDWSELWKVTIDNDSPEKPAGLKRLSKDKSKEYSCGDIAQRQTLIPTWDDVAVNDLSFDHYEYASFKPDGNVGTTKDLFVNEFFHDWVPTEDGINGYVVRSVDKAGNVSDWALSEKTLEGSCQITYDSTVPTANISYSTTDPTNGDVVATLNPSENVTVTNNSESLTHTFAENGNFIFEFKDAAGNTGTATATVDNIDKIAPTLADKTTFSGWYNSAQTSTFNYTDTNMTEEYSDLTCEISTEGANQTCAIVPINVCDEAGNCNAEEITSNGANIDLTKPTSVINGGNNNTIIYRNSWNGDISGTATDNLSGVKGVKISIQNSAGKYWNGLIWQEGETLVNVSGTTSWTYKLTSLGEGSYTIKSHAIDNAENQENTYTLTIVLDKTIPGINLTINPETANGKNGWYDSIPEINLNATDSVALDKIEYQIDSQTGTWINYTESIKIEDGEHVFYYRSLDLAGNYSNVGIKNVKVDTVNPDTVKGLDAYYDKDKNAIKLDWRAEDSDIHKVYIYRGSHKSFNINSGSRIAENDDNDNEITDRDVVVGEKYYYKLVSIDEAGNKSDIRTISVKVSEDGASAVVIDEGTESTPEFTEESSTPENQNNENPQGDNQVTDDAEDSDARVEGAETSREDIVQTQKRTWPYFGGLAGGGFLLAWYLRRRKNKVVDLG